MIYQKVWSDIIFLLVVYLLASTNFYTVYIHNDTLNFWIMLSLRLIFLIFGIYFIYKNTLPSLKFEEGRWSDVVFLPFFLLTMSNLFFIFIKSSLSINPINYLAILKGGVLDLFTAAAEELVFRVVILGQLLKQTTKFKALLYASIIFGVTHLVNISSLAMIVPVLIQVGYTFGIGLAAGFIYLETKNFFWPWTFHFLFNFLNNTLVKNLFVFSQGQLFYTINVLMALVSLIYGVILYRYINIKKGEKHVS